MQIVINISKTIKRLADEDDIKSLNHIIWLGLMIEAIREGTPIPKGHGRLIDADKAISKICGSACGCHLEECGYDKPCYSVTRIKSAPTIIEADRSEEDG